MCDSYLTPEQIEGFRAQLIEKRNGIINKRATAAEAEAETEKATDPLDRASQAEDLSTSNALNNHQEEVVLKEINFALANFEEFGYCLSCGEEIGLERLAFNPAFTMCVDCKQLEEQRHRGH